MFDIALAIFCTSVTDQFQIVAPGVSRSNFKCILDVPYFYSIQATFEFDNASVALVLKGSKGVISWTSLAETDVGCAMYFLCH